ncbi:MAG: radical SAM protein [Candidatus Omnitrophica bacterium]|nr:radical SAM protein [Candidatus Omnitrophota bacterium]
MHILLINPNDLYRRRYIILPNLALGYVAAGLEASGHKVEIWDEHKENRSLDKFKTKLCKVKDTFDLIGFYFPTSYYSAVLQYANLVKSINDNIITIVGGPHPTIEPLMTLRDIKSIDFAISGEGEEALPELIEAIRGRRRFEDVCNLAWRREGKVIINERKFLNDLDKIPIPAWHLLKPDTYPLAPIGIFTKKKNVAPIVFTRGCPFGCNFCAASVISGRVLRHRNLKNIIEEISLLKSKYNIEEIQPIDDCITANREYIASLCNILIKQKIRIHWACTNGVRVDTIDKELIQLMEEAGCYSISIGIESGVQRVLDLMKKNISIEEIKEKISLVKNFSSIRIAGYFVMGYPGETLIDMQKTIDFACSLKIDRANFFNFTPLPGTAAYNNLNLKYNKLIFDKLFLYSIPITFGDYSSKALKRVMLKANMKFYLRPKIILGLLKEIKSIHQVLTIIMRVKGLIRRI